MSSALSPALLLTCRGRCGSEPECLKVRCLPRLLVVLVVVVVVVLLVLVLLLLVLLLHREISSSVET
jgi:hypothetical protein